LKDFGGNQAEGFTSQYNKIVFNKTSRGIESFL